MADLAGRPPLGPKPAKQPKAARKPIPKQSKKRKAYMASAERKAGVIHMGLVARLPCLACGAHPVEVHHCPDHRSDMRVLSLCPRHHRREFGEGAYHYSPRAFRERHGTDEALLEIVAAMINVLD